MLSFLLISSVAFAVYMRVERMATSNYRHSVMARQLIQLAFADARNTVSEVVGNNGSTFWPIFYKTTPEARILMSLPKWRDSDGNMRDTDYPPDYTTGSTASSTEGTGLSFTPGAGPSLLNDEVIKHVPPALVADVMNARWQAQWRPIKQPQLVESDTGGSVSVNPVVGRYAWMAINVSDMLDVNALPSGVNTLDSGKRSFGSLGGADLKLDGDVGILKSISTYKTAADEGRFKARFLTGADLASLADDTALFKAGVLDWKSAVGLRTDADPVPLTVYSRFPVMPPYAELPSAASSSPSTSVKISDWTNGAAIAMSELNSAITPAVRSKIGKALGNLKNSNLDVKDFEAMIQEYVNPKDQAFPLGSGYPMLRPPMKPVPMISQIWFDFGSIQNALFDPTEKELEPGKPLTISINPNSAGLGSAAQIKVQVANLFDEEWKGSSSVEVQGGWAVFWNEGGAKNSKGTAFIAPKNGNLSTLEKGTFSTVALQYGFPDIPSITLVAPVPGMTFTVDLFFRFVINDFDELPLSELGIVQSCTPKSDPGLTDKEVSFCGERYFRTRVGFKLEKTVKAGAAPGSSIDVWKVVPDVTVLGAWNPAAGRWDSIDPRYNWFSPASSPTLTLKNSDKAQQVLAYFNVAGYDNTRSSIHWFFKQNGGSSGTEPSDLMKAVWAFARDNPDKGLDVVNPSGGYSENSKQRYYAFSHSGLGQMYSPLEFGFFPRFLYPVLADPGTWMNPPWEDKLPFYRSIRVYPYANSASADKDFLSYFSESIGTRKGLVYGGAPGIVGDLFREMQFNELPVAVSELNPGGNRTTISSATEKEYQELANAIDFGFISKKVEPKKGLPKWLKQMSDDQFASMKNNSDPGLQELNYSAHPVSSLPPAGCSVGLFRDITEIKALPEVKRKLLAAVTQCGTSRRQQLFLYILRADAYKPIIGDSLSGGSSSASCRAVALVWRDPFVKGAETMTGTATGLYRKEWFRGTTSGAGMGGSTTTATPEHAERLIYFQILD